MAKVMRRVGTSDVDQSSKVKYWTGKRVLPHDTNLVLGETSSGEITIPITVRNELFYNVSLTVAGRTTITNWKWSRLLPLSGVTLYPWMPPFGSPRRAPHLAAGRYADTVNNGFDLRVAFYRYWTGMRFIGSTIPTVNVGLTTQPINNGATVTASQVYFPTQSQRSDRTGKTFKMPDSFPTNGQIPYGIIIPASSSQYAFAHDHIMEFCFSPEAPT